jgi:hypothetical protein
MTIAIIILLSIISGVFGRMGGSDKYNGKWRDAGCSFLIVLALIILFGWQQERWWAYLAVFGLSWGAFSTYQDTIWGYDNLWASGFLVGLAAFPAYWLGVPWWVIGIRAIVLCLAWGLLNKYLPPKVWVWRRDVVEEFSRYFVSL